jgi:hypothetical protein
MEPRESLANSIDFSGWRHGCLGAECLRFATRQGASGGMSSLSSQVDSTPSQREAKQGSCMVR